MQAGTCMGRQLTLPTIMKSLQYGILNSTVLMFSLKPMLRNLTSYNVKAVYAMFQEGLVF
jgi:hypothetical protein